MSVRTRNIKILIAYDGTGYSGWQRQKKDITIQGEIERSLTRMTTENISLHGAGRTDAGVHAKGMCAHFITSSTISCPDFHRGLNSMLSSAIRIFFVEEVDLNFHSRYSAKGKHYQYSLYTAEIQSPLLRLYSWHVPSPLNLNIINACLKKLEGTHDFSSFENSGSRDKDSCRGRGAVRTINKARLITKSSTELVFEFTGDGFLRTMIRNLVGTLLECGRGRVNVEEFDKILRAKDRTTAGPAAPPHGLCLVKVLY